MFTYWPTTHIHILPGVSVRYINLKVRVCNNNVAPLKFYKLNV